MHTSLLGFTLAQIDFHRRRLPHLIPMLISTLTQSGENATVAKVD
jgi:hypothetical protein